MFSSLLDLLYSREQEIKTNVPTPVQENAVVTPSIPIDIPTGKPPPNFIIDENSDQDSTPSDLPELLSESSGEVTMFNNFAIGDDRPTESIEIADSDGKYNLYHFSECSNTSSKTTRDARGIIKKMGENGEEITVCKTFGYTVEFDSTQIVQINNAFEANLDKYKFYKAEEGTVLRLWHDTEWHVSSHRRIDAGSSRWGCVKSHKDLLISAVSYTFLNKKASAEEELRVFNGWLEVLNKDFVYAVIVRSVIENRVVCHPLDRPTVFFLGQFDAKSFALCEGNNSKLRSLERLNFKSVAEIISHAHNCNPYMNPGIVAFMNTDHGVECVKVTNAEYNNLSKIRGNVSSIRFRYLQIRLDPVMKEKFLSLYPDHVKTADDIEKLITKIAGDIYSQYMKRFALNNGVRSYIVMPKDQWFVARELYDAAQKKPEEKFTISTVLAYINSRPAHHINHLIKSEEERG